ncbi:hypothetical protein AURDEDRAFT_164492 [Auricularia subglabra TFB-10046 SS5]|nr:hypothetical protein AURDEDRAFT_164492 [Auricularia subglabra TFB-10046 SS5]
MPAQPRQLILTGMWSTTAFLTIALLGSPGICSPAESGSDVSLSGNHTAVAVLAPVAFEDAGARANLTPKAAGGFSHSCWNIQLVGSGNGLDLVAVCGNGPNGANNGWTYLPINNCFANNNGALSPARNGNAMHSCDSCYLYADARNWMACRCGRADGSLAWSPWTNLDSCVTNYDGNLGC